MKDSQRRFDGLRTWEGEQSRAFEELAFQLLKQDAPAGSRAIRTGNPDGGVEWFTTCTDGTEWGWQAKYVRGIDALLTAMTNSVERVAKERVFLRKLTFVISWNLATGTQGGERKSQRVKYEDKVATWRRTIAGAEDIEFDLVQGSDLLDRLALPEHAARAWFWFGDVVLGRDWLEQRFREEADAASDKYRPDLQVDVPIQDDIVSLGFGSPVLGGFHRLRRTLISAAADIDVWTKNADKAETRLYEEAGASITRLKEYAKEIRPQVATCRADFQTLTDQINSCRAALARVEDHEHDVRATWESTPAAEQEPEPPDRIGRYAVRRVHEAIFDLQRWADRGPGRLLAGEPYLLVGPAGSGKTHLLLDATKRALDDQRPAVFLSGARFGSGDLWASIADQLGLGGVGSDDLLGAMDAAGEASAPEGRRFLILIDALNDTVPPEFWTTYLPSLRSRVAHYPHVALVVSCRDTYRDLVIDETESQKYVQRTHPGFAEREAQAAERYFRHYGLESPRIPLITPEFTLPLFLRLYCEGIAAVETGHQPTGHQGRIEIFERYLTAKIRTIARRYRRGASSGYEVEATERHVRAALEALLDQMVQSGREGLNLDAAEELVVSALPPTDNAARMLGLLQDEAVLTRERLYLDGASVDGVRVVFQALSDFLLLKRRLDSSQDPLSDTALHSWLRDDCSWGIREAATIVMPELFEVEVPDLLLTKLRLTSRREDHSEDHDERRDETAEVAQQRARSLYKSLVTSLPYRRSDAITPRTIDLLNDAQRFLHREDFYNTLITMAPQPANRLNGEGLHRYLARFTMHTRDHDFGRATYTALEEEGSAVARLGRWVAGGPYHGYDPAVIENACISLCWLFSSPNRFMRDWLTKSLASLLSAHLDVATALVERFWPINDPYVVQRVIAVAYGALLNSAPADAEDARELAATVQRLVFTPPVRADELLLDDARGIVRWAVAHNLLPDSALIASTRPYGLKIPGPAPREENLEERFGHHDKQTTKTSYTSIYHSIFGLGDFGRYVIEFGIHHFTRHRIGSPSRQREHAGPRFVKRRWLAFMGSLDETQRADLADQLARPEPSMFSPLRRLRRGRPDPLRPDQRKLLEDVWGYPNVVDERYPADRARRWVMQRTVRLGWRPELFGEDDRRISYGNSGRDAHKAERWGKKYQWMAYHELLARVADNYQTDRVFDDDKPYEGLHQISDRDIDPSMPPVDFDTFLQRHDVDSGPPWSEALDCFPTWPPDKLSLNTYDGDIGRLIADRASEPTPMTSLRIADNDGEEWIALSMTSRQNDPDSDKDWRGIQQRVWADALLVPSRQSKALLEALTTEEAHRRLADKAAEGGHINCCYLGEVGRSSPTCPHRLEGDSALRLSNKTFNVTPLFESYTWEGSNRDCSIQETVRAWLPSTFVQTRSDLTFDPTGPTWLQQDAPVLRYLEGVEPRGRALLAKASFLQVLMKSNDLAIIFVHGFERNEMKPDYPADQHHPWHQVSTAARLDHDLVIHTGNAIHVGHPA